MSPRRGAELPLPPLELRFMKEDDDRFLRIGEELVADMVELCGLERDSTVLDVGCGYGRVAHALWRKGFVGRYLGLEIIAHDVEWCSSALTPASGGVLTFHHLDVRNDRYNARGAVEAQRASFPVPDAAFDVVVLSSVFTHMYPAEVRRYLEEIRRALRPGGRALTTWFSLDSTWAHAAADRPPAYPMPYELEAGCRYNSTSDPLRAVGYQPTWIRQQVADSSMTIRAERLGRWCGRPAAVGFQDAYVLARPGAETAATL